MGTSAQQPGKRTSTKTAGSASLTQRAQVAGYETLFELGQGGMGSTWVAVTRDSTEFERLVVIKRLREETMRDAEAVARFLAEARTAAYVHHANVVSIHQVGRDDRGPFLVEDYIEGATLEQLLDWCAITRRPLDLQASLRIALDVARGIGAIHSAEDARGRPLGILHRDISLQNILVGRDGVSRIADFGIAKSVLASVATGRHNILGKLLYMPPEYLQRQACDQALDVYSFGINLWMLLAGGRSPFQARTDVQLAWAICEVGVPPLGSRAPEVPRVIADFVDRACARDVDCRFQSGVELARALEDAARQLGVMPSYLAVADAIEDQLGETLARRRSRVAAALDELESTLPVADSEFGEEPRTGTQRRVFATAQSSSPPLKEMKRSLDAPTVRESEPRGSAWCFVLVVGLVIETLVLAYLAWRPN